MAPAGGNSTKRLGWSKLDATLSGNLVDSILSVGWMKLRTDNLDGYALERVSIIAKVRPLNVFLYEKYLLAFRLLSGSQAERHARYADHAARTARPSRVCARYARNIAHGFQIRE